MTADDVAAFEHCIRSGGVAVFPADTVYGLACDPRSSAAIECMYALKGRRPRQPSAVMFFQSGWALESLPPIGERTERALRALLPGPVTVVLPAKDGPFGLATSERGLGLRVPKLDGELAPLARAKVAVLQTSANLSGGPDPRTLGDVPRSIREGADVVLDGGELPGTPSTVIDLSRYGSKGRWELIREGALSRERVAELLAGKG